MKEYIISFNDSAHYAICCNEGRIRYTAESVVELVRCKDCIHHAEPYCTRFITGMIPVSDNDFCSFGERKKQNE